MRLKVARELWKAGCVTIRARPSFRWASGLRSPIYCDSRRLLSQLDGRTAIVKNFVETIRRRKIGCDAVAGVATAGIPWAALVAQRLNKPLLYVRPQAKGHGRREQVEGGTARGRRVLVIEDLVSTGGSSLRAVQTLRKRGAQVGHLLALFAYLPEPLQKTFRRHRLHFFPLAEIEALLAAGRELKKLDRQKEATARRFLARLATHLAGR